MAFLIAYGRVSPSGLLAWGREGTARTAWNELDAGRPGEFGIPTLRARYFFDEPFTKYGRMDPLCKVAVGAAQLAVKAGGGLEGFDRDEIAQVGGTMLGCLEVDARFDASRRAGAPSPALFVYTLPSMFQGEIAIRYGLRGRCTLLSTGALSSMTALAQGIRWIEKGRARHVLVVGADAAGPAARTLGDDFAPMSAGAAWLLAGEGGGVALSDTRFNSDPGGASVLKPGGLKYGTTFVDALEPLLIDGYRGRVHAAVGARSTSFRIG